MDEITDMERSEAGALQIEDYKPFDLHYELVYAIIPRQDNVCPPLSRVESEALPFHDSFYFPSSCVGCRMPNAMLAYLMYSFMHSRITSCN